MDLFLSFIGGCLFSYFITKYSIEKNNNYQNCRYYNENLGNLYALKNELKHNYFSIQYLKDCRTINDIKSCFNNIETNLRLDSWNNFDIKYASGEWYSDIADFYDIIKRYINSSKKSPDFNINSNEIESLIELAVIADDGINQKINLLSTQINKLNCSK